MPPARSRRRLPTAPLVTALLVAALLATACSSKGDEAKPGDAFTISTFAGRAAEMGDGGPATDADLIDPSGLAIGPDGSVFIADDVANVVRRVAPDGVITTVAGTRDIGFDGEFAPGLVARLNQPQGLAVDAAGNLIIADTGNARVRRLSADGMITTTAGTGVPGSEGDGLSGLRAQLLLPLGVAVAPDGSVVIADTGNKRIRQVDPTGGISTIAGSGEAPPPNVIVGDGEDATNAPLAEPSSVAVAADGSLLIADRGAGAIRRLARDRTITTVATVADVQGALSLPRLADAPFAVADSPQGIVVLETRSGRLERVSDGKTTTLAPEGTFLQGRAIAVRGDGTILVADAGRRQIVSVPSEGLQGKAPTPFAGNGTAGDLGDGEPASQATLLLPIAVATGKDGSLFVADRLANQIRKVTPNGIISTIAGTGQGGFSGDGGPATKARLRSPEAVAVDARGRVLIADGGNLRIRRIDTDGTITTVAGNGSNLPGADGTDARSSGIFPNALAVAPDGSVVVAEASLRRIVRIAGDGTRTTIAGRPGDAVQFASPVAVTVDPAGSVFVADGAAHRIARVGPDGSVQWFAGSGEPGSEVGARDTSKFDTPQGILAVGRDQVVVADTGNNSIRLVSTEGTRVVQGNGRPGWTGDGLGRTEVTLGSPSAIAVAPDSTVYVVQPDLRVVRSFAPPDYLARTAVGTGRKAPVRDGERATDARLDSPLSVAVTADGVVYVADTDHQRVRRIDTDGRISTVAGNGQPGFAGDGAAAGGAVLDSPNGVATAGDGSLYIADTGNRRVRRVGPDGKITTFAGTGEAGSGGDGGKATAATLQRPVAVAVDPAGAVLIADAEGGTVRKVAPDGKISTVAKGLKRPAGLAIDPKGQVVVADEGGQRVVRIGAGGKLTTVAGKGTVGFTGDGGKATAAAFNSPVGVVYDRDGNLYVSDSLNARVRRVDADGRIETVAGTGAPGTGGDGEPAGTAQLLLPTGLAAHPDGTILVADSYNDRVRTLTPR